MKKLNILFALLLMLAVSAMAQDRIVTLKWDTIECKVEKIGLEVVEYRKFSNPNGPLYEISKKEVRNIQYENGDKDEFVKSGKIGTHDYVDLGLPSGTLWATCNVGASSPTEYGDYFAWGETEPKNDYSWENYKWCKGSKNTMTKYCDGSEYGEVDGIKKLLSEDDAATANWGAGWRMPTKAEQEELRNGCNWEWTYDFNGSGVAGQVGTSKTNGNTIFLPAAGDRYDTDLKNAGNFGLYWSSSLYEGDSGSAYLLDFYSDYIGWFNDYRDDGQSVRAVVK